MNIVAQYDYLDRFGELLYQVVRLDPKDFRQRRPDGNGGYIWSLNGVKRIPYRLPELLGSTPDMVFIPEGEKDADWLCELGFAATTNASGANSEWTPEMASYLAGRDVAVLCDNDGPGLEHAQKLCESLHGTAKSLRIVWLPGLPPRGDVSDWFDAGHTLKEFHEVVDATPLWEAPAISASGDLSDWPDPLPLQPELPPVPEFRSEWLPDPLRPLVEEISASMQVPVDYPGAALIVSLAGAIGGRAKIRPKYLDRSWRETCNLWGCIIGPPGALKTPVLARITAPLVAIEADWSEVQKAEQAVYENAKADIALEQSVWEQAAKAAIRENKPRPARPDSTLWEPNQRRLLVTDATYESLHVIQSQNPGGVLCTRDELSGFLAGLDSEGREKEKPYWLQCWSGSGHHALDRIGRGHIFVKKTVASLLGNLTPGGAVRLVTAMASGKADDGFIQRFGVTVWPDTPKDWKWVDRINDECTIDAWERIARALVRLSATDPLLMNFDAQSQERFIGWYTDLHRKISSDTVHPAMASHLSKYSKLVPVVAACFELAELAHRGALECHAEIEPPYLDRVRRHILLEPEEPTVSTVPMEATPVTLSNMERSIALCGYLEQHANRLYACVITPQIRAGHSLARHIKKGDLGQEFSTREVERRCWSDLSERELVAAALQHLTDLHWIRAAETAPSPQGGRPSQVWHVNPRALK